jgi:hypothetical protein
MNKLLQQIALCVSVLTLAACSSAFDKRAKTVDWTKGAVVVLSTSLKNEYRTGFQPTTLGVSIAKVKAPEAQASRIDAVDVLQNDMSVLVRQLLPGTYNIKALQGMAAKFPFVAGINFGTEGQFDIAPQGLFYLGHIAAVNVENKNKDDQATGDVLPLIDQAVAGFSGGTLRVNLEDRYDAVASHLKAEYPALLPIPLQRQLLAELRLDRAMGSKAAPIVLTRSADAADASSTPVSSTNAAAAAAPRADIANADAVPGLSSKGRAAYQEWLTRPLPRAFVIGVTKGSSYYWPSYGRSPPDATQPADPLERALVNCKKNAGFECKAYAVDNAVVWTP